MLLVSALVVCVGVVLGKSISSAGNSMGKSIHSVGNISAGASVLAKELQTLGNSFTAPAAGAAQVLGDSLDNTLRSLEWVAPACSLPRALSASASASVNTMLTSR